VRDFDGDLDDYLAWLAARKARPAAPSGRKAPPVTEKQKAGRRRPLAKEAEDLDRRIAALQEEKRRLDARLASPAFYAEAGTAQGKEAARRQQEIERLIEETEHRWLEVHAELETLDGTSS
jgi:ATP-binding cassette subfamily F protein 3